MHFTIVLLLLTLSTSTPLSSSASNLTLPDAPLCPTTPLPLSNPPGCIHLQNLLSSQAEALQTDFLAALSAAELSNPDADALKNTLLTPLTASAASLIHTLRTQPGLRDTNVCLGNFASSEPLSLYEGLCDQLPLSPHTWSVFGFSLALGLDSPFREYCPDFTSGYASFCMALTKDCANTPSIVFSYNPHLFKCQPFDALLLASTLGLSEIFVQLASEVVSHVTFGISFSNSFLRHATLHDGDAVVGVAMPGTIYSSGGLDFGPADFQFGLPDFLKLSGDGTKLVSLEGVPEAVDAAILHLQYAPLAVDTLLSLLDVVYEVDYRLLGVFNLKIDLLFSQLDLGVALPDLIGLEADATVYVSNAPPTAEVPLHPGLYIYSQAPNSAVVTAILEALLNSLETPLAAVPSWLPADLNPSQVLDFIDFNSDDVEFAIVVYADNRARIMLRLPLVHEALGFVRLTCEIRLDRAEITCKPETGLGGGGIVDVLVTAGRVFVRKLLDFGEATGDLIYENVFEPLSGIGDTFNGLSLDQARQKGQDLLDSGQDVLDDVGQDVIVAGQDVIQAGQDGLDDLVGGIF